MQAFRNILWQFTQKETQYHIYEDQGSPLRWVQVNDLLFHPGTAALFQRYNENNVMKLLPNRKRDGRLTIIASGGANNSGGQSRKSRRNRAKVSRQAEPQATDPGHGTPPTPMERIIRRKYDRVELTLTAYQLI